MDLLQLVADAPAPPRISNLATALAIPRNSAYELVYTLAAGKYLRLGEDGRVSLGVRLFELGSRYALSLDLVRDAREVAIRLRDASGETVHVATLDGRDAIYLLKEESRQAVRMSSAIGRRLPAHVSGVGKAMLAALDPADLRSRLEGAQLERLTPNSITSVSDLLLDLEQVRARGYSIDNQESSPDVACVAAAIRDGQGAVAAGMSVSGPVTRMTAERRPELARMVIDATAELSARLGFGNDRARPERSVIRRVTPPIPAQ